MKIILDVTCVQGIFCGYEIYAENLLRNLLPLLVSDGHKVTLLIQRKLPKRHWLFKELKRYPEIKRLKCNIPVLGPSRILKSKSLREVFEEDYDLYHCLHSNPLPCSHIKSVATVHDLTALKIKGYFSGSGIIKRLYLKWEYNYLLGKMNRIIAVSNSTKNDTQKLLEIPGEKISVIYEAARDLIFGKKLPGVLKNKKYFLAMGSRPHKNLKTVIESFQQYCYKNKTDSLLVIVARKNKYVLAVSGRIDKKIKDRLIILDDVSNEMLASLYQNSICFIYLSHYEGFGLPVLEAMSVGAPVIASNTSSLPEIAGNACCLVPPCKISEIVLQMEKIYNSGEFRENLIERGKKQAESFTWQATAQRTADLYQSL